MENKPLHILIIEDNPADLRLAKELLLEQKSLFCELTSATSLTTAKHELKKKKFDVVLLDLFLPDSEGLNTFRAINQHILHQCPIIILSGSQDKELALTAVKEGAQEFLVKGTFDGKFLSRAIAHSLERQRNENAIREYAALFENMQVAIFWHNLDGIIIKWNNAAERIFGYDAEEAIGQPLSFLVPPKQKDDTGLVLSKLKNGQPILQYETSRMRKDQKIIDVLLSISPTKNEEGTILGGAVLAYDITDRKMLERQLAIQYRIALTLTDAANLAHAAQSFLKTICEIMNWQVGEIWAIDLSIHALRQVLRWASSHIVFPPQKETELLLQSGEGIPGHIWATQRPFWSEDISTEPLCLEKEMLLHNHLNSCFGFPVLFQGHPLGVLIFFAHDILAPEPGMLAMFNAISEQIGTFIKRKRMEGDLLYLAQHDTLTGLANRVSLEDNFVAAIHHARRNSSLVALLYLDLDHFKKINDTLGHAKGDLLLQEISKRLSSMLRSTDTVARFGGDEFIILLPNLLSFEDIKKIAKKVLINFSRPFILDNREFYITASIGISAYPTDGQTMDALLKSADLALYLAKDNGRNNYQFCPSNVAKLAKQKYQLESELHHAFQQKEFHLYYQPVVSLSTGKIVGTEALIRWFHPDGRIILPGDFVPQLEQTALINPVGEWVVEAACTQLKQWQDLGIATSVSINVSIHQLNKRFINRVKQILQENRFDPHRFAIELTENSFIQENKRNIELLLALKALGVLIFLDDFGTGYSSLNYLKNFSVDRLKIDRSFIAGIQTNPNLAAIVAGIIAMAHALNIKVIAEGVENEGQLHFLKMSHCDEYQGYFFSEPLPPEKLLRLLQKPAPSVV